MKLPTVPYLKEYVTTLCVTLAACSSGAHLGWSSPSIPKLKLDDSPVKITDDEGSWIVAIFLLGSIFGIIPAGFLMNRIGRKAALLMSAIPYIIAWVMILLADSVVILCIARFFGGVGHGAAYTVVPIYLGEIASKEIRGILGTMLTVMSKVGILLAYCVGPFVPYETLPYVLMSPAIILLATYFIIRESPYYCLMKHREEDAMASLKYLRGHDDIRLLQQELNNMRISVKYDQENKGSIKGLFKVKGNRRALFIILSCGFGQQFCGSQAVIAYAQEIFAEADGVLGASDSAIVLGVAQLLIIIASTSIVDRVGRRSLLLGSTAGVTITTAVMGGYFYMKYHLESDVSSLSWLPITTIIIYVISYTVGLATIPFVLGSELFPTNVKAAAFFVGGTAFSLYGFSVTKLYQVVSDGFGTYVTFWGFSIISLVCFITYFVSLPETKGKSLVEIQLLLNNRKVEENIA